MIRSEGIYKVFGKNPEKAIKLLEQGRTNEEIYSETKQIVAVAGVDLEIKEGDIFVIMGLSGSGKSTLLRCMNRLVEPTKGRIFFRLGKEEKEITRMKSKELIDLRRYYVSVVFQQFALLPNRTVMENVTLGLEVQGKSKETRRKTAMETIELVGLSQWADAYPSQLSGGMKQRVGLARALATGGKVLLMDEPFSALDPLIKYNMQSELLKLQSQLSKAILFVTHDLSEALRIGDRIAIMEQGKFVQVGVPEEIIINPKTEYVSNFVKSADPTDVVTAKSIMLPIERKFDNETVSFHDGATRYEFKLDSKNQLRGIFANGRRIGAQRYYEKKANPFSKPSKADTAVVLSETATLRELIGFKLHCPYPLIIVSENDAFRGIVTNRIILESVLKKFQEKETFLYDEKHKDEFSK